MPDETVVDQGTPPATPANEEGTTLLTGAPDPVVDETKPDEGKTAEGTSADPKVDPPAPAVPEHYELKAPDGATLDPDAFAAYEPVFKKLGMSNEAVQELVDLQAKQQGEALEKMNAQWIAELKADKEIGGSKLLASQKLGQMSLARFGSPELVSFLEGSKLGNNPLLVKYFAKIGAAMSEAGIVPGNAGSPPIPVEQKMFPNTK